MNAAETSIAAVEPEQDEAALVMEALKIVHGKPTMAIASKTLMTALHNSHVRTFQKINEILDGPGNEYAKLALIRRLTKAAGKGEAA